MTGDERHYKVARAICRMQALRDADVPRWFKTDAFEAHVAERFAADETHFLFLATAAIGAFTQHETGVESW